MPKYGLASDLANVTGAPPSTGTFSTALPTINATHAPSGEIVNACASPVPAIGTAERLARCLIQSSAPPPLTALPVRGPKKTRYDPSGDGIGT